MSEPSTGQCFTLGLNEAGVVYESSCLVDVLDTAIHFVFVFIFGIWIVYYLNRKDNTDTSLPNTNGSDHKNHVGRWLLSSGIVLSSIAAIIEGILTALTGQYHLKNVSHLFIPYLLTLCSVLLSLWFSYEMDRENSRQAGSVTVMVYSFCALCGQLLRIGHLLPLNGVTILTTRIDISGIIVAFYIGLTVVELHAICKYKQSKPKDGCKKASIFDNERSTILSRLTYHWMRDVFSFYKSKDIQDIVEDLGPMPRQYQVNYIQKIWIRQWQTEKEAALKGSRRASLWRIIIKIIGTNQLKAASFKLTADLLSYLGPIILAGTVHYTMQSNCADIECKYENIGFHYVTIQEYFQNGFVLMYFLFITYLLNFILNETHLFWTSVQGLQSQAGLQALIYQKALRLWGTGNGQNHLAVGKLMNLASVDAKCIYVSYTWCEVWAAPLRLLITFGILIQAYGMSAFVGLLILILLVPLQLVCGFFISSLQRQKKKYADARTRVSNELFQSIKTIKALAWEDIFCDKISDTRRQELKPLFKQLMVLSFILCISSCLPLFVTATILGLYSQFSGLPLTPARAFFAVSLLNQLVAPLTDFSVYMNILVNAKVSINRILRFLESPEISAGDVMVNKSIPDEEDTPAGDAWNDINVSEKTPLMNVNTNTSKGSRYLPTEEYDEDDNTVFKIVNGSFCTFDKKLVLRNVNVTIPRGGLTLLMGPVGSGKSSLLLALLEELTTASGEYMGRHNLSSVAYCCQRGGILNASLKDNILFGRAYNESRYRTVIDACCLRPDIDILPAQDETEIGERGINLSGGQKQRLSLARALYSDKEILLLDDPLSSLDVHVKRAVFHKAVGMMRGEGKTVLLVVNNTANCEQADHVIMMNNGTVKDEGSPKDLIDKRVLSIGQSDGDDSNEYTNNMPEQQIELERINLKILLQKEFTKDSREMLTENEGYDAGDVSWRVYAFYFRACSTVIVLLSISMLAVRAIFCLSSDLWLAAWSEAGISNTTSADNSSLGYYLTGYLSLGSMITLATVVGCVLVKTGSLSGAQRIHEAMLIRVVHAPARFYDVNPLGRLLNRFTSDVNTADIRLEGTVTMVQYATVSVITAIIANTIVAPLFLLLTVPLAILFFLIFRKYLSLSMKLQRAANVSRSPVLSFLAESVNTVTTVRAYRDQCRFYNTYIDKLERYTAVSFYLTAVQRWLAIRLDLLGTVAMLVAGIAALISTLYFNSPVSYVGVSLAYSLQISYFLGQWVRSVSRLELCMNSIERIKSFCEIKTERYNGFPPEDDWPRDGSVRFHNVHVRYASHLDAVLTDINIDVSGGQKVGICGRTGSGKSTLALTFLRFVDIFKGYVTIDGLDIKSIPLKVLRQRVAIIQQEAVLFSGTIRSNLDPYNIYNDEELWRILDQVHMRDSIPSKTGLTTLVQETGSNFSAGQRQLLCLARALLRYTKILVMDEATATIDEETNRLVESVVENEFRDKTVFTIVHRLESIINYDVILVLDSSRIVEAGSPDVLLRSPDGIFKSMVQKQK